MVGLTSTITIESIEKNVWLFQDEHVRFFLLGGQTFAILLDTGLTPDAGLLDCCCELTGNQKIVVLNTHADGDHCGNNFLFEDVRMHPSDFEFYRYHSGCTQLVHPGAIWDGEQIDNGQFTLEVIHVPGHTPGSTVYWDRRNRRIFVGDTICSDPVYMFGPERSLEAMLLSLKRIEYLSDLAESIYCCHGKAILPIQDLPAFIMGCETILHGGGTSQPSGKEFPPDVRIWRSGKAQLLYINSLSEEVRR
ncbi:MBL fold metallo-hydrolase [Lachnospiraceae bacterium ZAX-1]